MCSNDVTAIGVLHKLYRAGLKAPDDFSVIGFDDIQIAHREEGGEPQRYYKIPTQLMVRESTGAPRGIKSNLRKRDKIPAAAHP